MPVIHPPTIPAGLTEILSRAIRTKEAASLLPATVGEVPEPQGGEKAAPANTVYTNLVKLFLVNPDALQEMFQKGQEISQQPSLNRLLPETVHRTLTNVTRMMDALLSSPKSLSNPLLLKDYAAKLGLSLERSWLDAIVQGRDGQRPAESLKSLLLQLAGELQELSKAGPALPPEELQKLTELVKFTESSLRAIETQQLLNVFSQENDNKYLLQIPLLFPGNIRTGEIIIEPGKDGAAGTGKKKKSRVVMFLSMDQLGEMMVDASLSENTIFCAFHFTDPEAQAFCDPLLAGLSDALHRLGYDNASMTSSVTPDLAAIRQTCHREMMPEQDAVNLFA